MKIAARLLKSAGSFFLMVALYAAFSGSWLHPDPVWSEVVLVKKSSARPTVYLGSMTSNQFPSAQQMECAPANFACAKQNNNPGPVPAALKSSYVNELQAKGVIVVMEKPVDGTFYEVSVSFIIRGLPSSPPNVPESYVCDVRGMIIRHGAGGTRKRELDRDSAAVRGSASSAISSCLEPASADVRKGIDAINQPQSKKAKQYYPETDQ